MAQLEVGEILVRGPTNFWDFSHFYYKTNLGLPDPQWETNLAPLFKKITHSIFFTDLLQGLSIRTHYKHLVLLYTLYTYCNS